MAVVLEGMSSGGGVLLFCMMPNVQKRIRKSELSSKLRGCFAVRLLKLPIQAASRMFRRSFELSACSCQEGSDDAAAPGKPRGAGACLLKRCQIPLELYTTLNPKP